MPLQGGDQRFVGQLMVARDDPAEVAHRLVVVEDEGKGDAGGHVTRS
jgi:hypothetical protein